MLGYKSSTPEEIALDNITDTALRDVWQQVNECHQCPNACPNPLMRFGKVHGILVVNSHESTAFPLNTIIEEITHQGVPQEYISYCEIINCDKAIPDPENIRNCLSFLDRLILILRPIRMIMLGKTVIVSLFPEIKQSVMMIHGQWFSYRGIPAIATFRQPPEDTPELFSLDISKVLKGVLSTCPTR